MRAVFALALLLLAAPALSATESTPATDAPAAAEVVTVNDAPEAPAMNLEKVNVEQRASAESRDAAAQDMPARGSFWWLVGVIVVAGVLLALLLD